MSDIEVHYNEEQRQLDLACAPDDFAAYRDVVRKQLAGWSEIDVDAIVEVNVVNTEGYAARRDAPRARIWQVLFGAVVLLVVGLAIVGAVSLMTR